MAEEKEMLRVYLTPSLRACLDELVAEKKSDNTKLVGQLLEWFLEQDSLFQSILLGQVPADDDVAELALARIRAAVGTEPGQTAPV